MIKPLKLRCIQDDINDKVVEVENWDTQKHKSLKYEIGKLELDKWND